MELLSTFILWLSPAVWSRDITMYLVLSAFTSSSISLVATTLIYYCGYTETNFIINRFHWIFLDMRNTGNICAVLIWILFSQLTFTFLPPFFFHIRSAAVVFLWHYSRNTCHVRVLLLEVRCIRIEFLPEPADVWSPNSVCVIDIPSWVNTSPHWQYWHFYLVAYCAASQIFVVSFHFQKKIFMKYLYTG